MKLTPEQRAAAEQQKAAGATHLDFSATPEQAAELLDQASAIQAARPELAAHYRKLVTASEESGFSGWLRRRIREARRPIPRLAAESGVDVLTLEAFRAGEATLPSDAIDRLIEVLGLPLAEETMRS